MTMGLLCFSWVAGFVIASGYVHGIEVRDERTLSVEATGRVKKVQKAEDMIRKVSKKPSASSTMLNSLEGAKDMNEVLVAAGTSNDLATKDGRPQWHTPVVMTPWGDDLTNGDGRPRWHTPASGNRGKSVCSWAYRQHNSENMVRYNLDWDPNRRNWGNRLSTYWEARAIAAIAGKKFSMNFGRFPESWLHYLPIEAPIFLDRKDSVSHEKVCASCKTCKRCEKGRYPHHCGSAAWTKIREVVQVETKAAMTAFEKAEPGMKPPSLVEVDGDGVHVLFHMRLEFVHPQISWPAKSFFQGKLTPQTKSVTILHMPYLQKDYHLEMHGGHVHVKYSPEEQSNITALIKGYSQILSELCDGCAVSAQAKGQYESWAMITRHRGPLFCMSSTFCLWAGLANEHGPIYFPADFASPGTRSNVAGGKGQGFFWNGGKMLSNLNISLNKDGLGSESDVSFQLMRASSIVDWARAN